MREEVLLFASENSVVKASEKYGVSTKTIYNWRSNQIDSGSKVGSSGSGSGSGSGSCGKLSIETEGEYLVIRIPKKMALREVLGGLI